MNGHAGAEQIHAAIDRVLNPGHFFVAGNRQLSVRFVPAQELCWEIFRGRLLDAAHTRCKQTFTSWNLCLDDEPVLSLCLDRDAGELHVVRSILSYGWEAFDSGNNVIESREVTKRARELVTTIALAQFPSAKELHQEIASAVFHIFVGTSRLPLTAEESPLPDYSLGRLAYFRDVTSSGQAVRSPAKLIEHGLIADLSWTETAKLLEFVLRAIAPEDVADAAGLWAKGWLITRDAALLPRLFRSLFNEVSLSPYTNFVDNSLAFLQSLVDAGTLSLESQADFLSHLLRQLCRHLTAYDLITFHHRGANYPDALLLDTALKAYLRLIRIHPAVFAAEEQFVRRRALRQALLVRRFYEGHPVPDAPTSPGESARVLPLPFERIPEEQILEASRRRRKLYVGEPTRELLRQSCRDVFQIAMHDMNKSDELRELGIGIFIDRPLGVGKARGEPDQTPLFSHEAFSASIARRRLQELWCLAQGAGLDFSDLVPRLWPLVSHSPGVPARELPPPDRPVACAADALRAADDFIFVRTTRACRVRFLGLFDWGPRAAQVQFLKEGGLILPMARGLLAGYDRQLNRLLELELRPEAGFIRRGGIERPRGVRLRIGGEPPVDIRPV